MNQLPLCSSREVVRALRRLGFADRPVPKTGASGSHRTFVKKQDGATTSVTVPLGAREIPRGTLRSILRQAGLSPRQFRDALGIRSKGGSKKRKR
ncbi:MAG TPA: type II toxin-antitoxin system HicA family toxin [Actinomycetota bacterium]